VNRAGFVLTGGLSSRMGRDKALLPYRGEPLAGFVARLVAQAAGSAALVGSAQRHGTLGYPVIEDRYPGQGPLGGIVTALESTAADWNLIVACDMPRLSAPFLTGLLEAAARSESDALVPAGPQGLLEPMCAVYHRRALDGLAAAFHGGTRKITTALEIVRVAVLPVTEITHFQNVNTAEEWATCDQ